jgi:hypothetical protein
MSDARRWPGAAGLARERGEAIARVLPVWPHEIDDRSEDGRRRLLARLARALRAERRRGVAGHWTYDLARHAALLRLYREELAALGAPAGKAGERRQQMQPPRRRE